MDAPQLLSVTAVATRLGCSRGHIYDLIAAGHFRPVDIGAKTRTKTRIMAHELDVFIRTRTRAVPG